MFSRWKAQKMRKNCENHKQKANTSKQRAKTNY